MGLETDQTNHNKKTRSVSFRIPEDLADSLETESEVKRITSSNLLTQILRHYIEFEGNMGKVGLVSFPRPLLEKLMEGYPEKQVIALAEHVARDDTFDMVSVLQGQFTIESFLKTTEQWAKSCNMPFRYERKGSLTTCVIQHDLGKNWSLFLGHLYKSVIEELTEKKVSIDTTDNLVRFRF